MRFGVAVTGFALLVCSFFASASEAALSTVPYVDLSQYAGTWYRISGNPLVFEGECACARQVLAGRANGKIDVHNSCNDKTPSGVLREIRGFATPDDTTNSKLTVDFGLPRTGSYWVIGLGQNYEYAVVTDASGASLYILSKTPDLSQALYDEALATAATQVDTSKLVTTVQAGCSYP